jgi:hypothetical protein
LVFPGPCVVLWGSGGWAAPAVNKTPGPHNTQAHRTLNQHYTIYHQIDLYFMYL